MHVPSLLQYPTTLSPPLCHMWSLESDRACEPNLPPLGVALHPLQGPEVGGPLQHMLPRPPHEPRIALGLRLHAETQIKTPLLL
jgi:hypothetical protein